MSLRSKLTKSFVGALAALTAFHFSTANAVVTPVDLELQLLVDVSGSIDNGEFNTQRDGYEAAFRNAGIISAIEAGTIGSIAVQLIYWSTSNRQQVAVDWFQISDSTTSNAFADAVAAAARPFDNSTGIGAAINFGTPLFSSNDFDGTRKVIDVSGDGVNNSGVAPASARDAALAAGIDTINAVVIGSESLRDYFVANVIGGTNAFAVRAADFTAFSKAVANKIRTEIIGGPTVPIPGALPLMLTGLAFFRWRKKKKAQPA